MSRTDARSLGAWVLPGLALAALTAASAAGQTPATEADNLRFSFRNYTVVASGNVTVTCDGQVLPESRYKVEADKISVFDENGHLVGLVELWPSGGSVRTFVPPEPRALMGVWLGTVDEALASQLGVAADQVALVTDVGEGSPAAAAGLNQHDVIVEINGQRPAGEERVREVIAEHKPGDSIGIRIMRRGQPQELHAVLGQRPEENVPILPDVPLLGYLFRSSESAEFTPQVETLDGTFRTRVHRPGMQSWVETGEDGRYLVKVTPTVTRTRITTATKEVPAEATATFTQQARATEETPDLGDRISELEARVKKLTEAVEALLEREK